MPSILTEIKELFGDKSLYQILNIEKGASKNEVRKAYYQLSLKVHPDRVPADQLEKATKEFQVLGKIYEVLSDDGKRALYDEQGSVDDECSATNDDRNWSEYWRLLFPRVKLDDIEKFTKQYKNSKEELEELKQAYVLNEGKMDHIIDSVMCASVDDEPRFRKILEGLIAKGMLTAFPAFTHERKSKQEARKRKAAVEEKQAEKMRKKLEGNDKKDLSAMILHNQKTRGQQADAFFAYMEQKYGDGAAGTAESSEAEESEEAEDSPAESPAKRRRTASRKKSPSATTKSKNNAAKVSKSPAKKATVAAAAAKPKSPTKKPAAKGKSRAVKSKGCKSKSKSK